MAPLKLPAVVPIKRFYPHVDEITDPNAQQSTRLAWDRIHDLEGRLQAAEAANALLAAAHNTNATAIVSATQTAKDAVAIAQTPVAAVIPTSTSGTPAGAPPVGPPAGNLGSQTNPIIAMSTDPTKIAASVRASRQFYGFGPGVSDQYWIDKASVAGQFSNGKWYQGWNRYWEVRADPANTGSADPNLGGQAALHT